MMRPGLAEQQRMNMKSWQNIHQLVMDGRQIVLMDRDGDTFQRSASPSLNLSDYLYWCEISAHEPRASLQSEGK
jgi:hypothetical protein